DVIDGMDASLRAALSRGVVVIADDAERLDRWSAAAIARCRPAGVILRSFAVSPEESFNESDATEVVRLSALDEAALRPLFAGPERFFHLQTDGARALFARTGGMPARIADEVNTWVRAGLARWDQVLLVVDRDALDRLDSGLQVAPLPSSHSGHGTAKVLSSDLQELLAWIGMIGPHSSVDLLASLTGEPVWRIEADVEDLALSGAAQRFPDGRLAPRITASPRWPLSRRREAHRAIAAALPPGAESRLIHMLASAEGMPIAEASAIAREALAYARLRAEAGRLGQATAALREGLAVVRRRPEAAEHPCAAEEEALLAFWVEIALFEATPASLDRILYELCRTWPRTELVTHLEALVRAALALAAGSDRVLAMADAVAPFSDPGLERGRHSIRVLAARRISPERLAAVLDNVTAWASRSGDRAAQAALAGWMGRLRYQQGRYAESADLHAKAAAGEPWIVARIVAMVQGTTSLLETFCLNDAAALAQKALDEAARCRLPHFEAAAANYLRTIAYRAGVATSPDLDLIEAVARVGVGDIEAMVCLTESAVLFRAGCSAQAVETADRAYRLWTSMGKQWPALLARCLSIACGGPAVFDEARALGDRAVRCPVQGIGIQALALLATGLPAARDLWRSDVLPLAEQVPRSAWHLRIDVLSVREALEALGVEADAG
ncbi:MAG TPA: hypothetical protein VE093_46165, partial [Polyangiaceae bacterium]|nr:hypothetical protein [Polyangiaceae bacterium]